MASAHILVNCDAGYENQIISEQKKFESIREAKEVYGMFNIIVKLESQNIQELRENSSERVRKIKNIISTITLMDNNNNL